MKQLKELTLIVNKKQIRSLEQMDFPFGKDSKIAELYDILTENKFDTEEEIAQHFYPDASELVRADSYRHLKSTLISRLINVLFFINKSSYNSYQRAYYECYKSWAAIKILLGRNARTVAVELAEKTLKNATHYEFTDLCVNICEILRLHYATREGNFAKFKEYNDLCRSYKAVLDVESLSEEYYLTLVINFVNDKSSKHGLHLTALEFYTELEGYMKLYNSYRLHLHGYLVKLMVYTSINDYRNTAKACHEAIDFFKTKDFEVHVPLQIFYYQLLVSYIHLREVEQGAIIAQQCLALLEEGSFNWFKYQELYFSLHTHSKEYQKAYSLYKDVISHSRFNFLSSNIREIWKIYEAYLHYLAEHKKITIEENDDTFSKFRLGRFLNDTPTYSKDKRGMNIAILVIQILTFILEKKYNKAIDSTDAIRRYNNRYLTQDNTYRSNCFIKMLLAIPACNFHRAAVMRKTEPYLKKLKEAPLESVGEEHEIEIIPYEDLWELVLESLDNTIPRKSSKRAIG